MLGDHKCAAEGGECSKVTAFHHPFEDWLPDASKMGSDHRGRKERDHEEREDEVE